MYSTAKWRDAFVNRCIEQSRGIQTLVNSIASPGPKWWLIMMIDNVDDNDDDDDDDDMMMMIWWWYDDDDINPLQRSASHIPSKIALIAQSH